MKYYQLEIFEYSAANFVTPLIILKYKVSPNCSVKIRAIFSKAILFLVLQKRLAVPFSTVCDKDCGLSNIDMIILFACLVGWLNSSPVEI